MSLLIICILAIGVVFCILYEIQRVQNINNNTIESNFKETEKTFITFSERLEEIEKRIEQLENK